MSHVSGHVLQHRPAQLRPRTCGHRVGKVGAKHFSRRRRTVALLQFAPLRDTDEAVRKGENLFLMHTEIFYMVFERKEKLTQGEKGYNCVPKEEAVDLGENCGFDLVFYSI